MAIETKTLTVGKAARRAGVSEKAVRLYESRGLLEPAERSEAGYRRFTEGDVAVLRFIRQARALGLHLDEIREIVDLQREGAQPCGQVVQMLDAHIREIDRTMADLRALRRSLIGARRTAAESNLNGEAAVVCRIIEASPT